MKTSEFARHDQSSKEGSSRFTLTARTLALALALAFVVGACDAYAQGDGGGSSRGDDLTPSVAAPADAAEVAIPFELTLESNVVEFGLDRILAGRGDIAAGACSRPRG
jgi:hypothetical protein